MILLNLYKILQTAKYNPIHICDVLRDLVPFAQFKKREKHPWRSVIFSKVAGCLPLPLTQKSNDA